MNASHCHCYIFKVRMNRGLLVVHRATTGNAGDNVEYGLVFDGTKCGENAICVNRTCQSVSLHRPVRACPTRNGKECSGSGLCSNANICYCNEGILLPKLTVQWLKRSRNNVLVRPEDSKKFVYIWITGYLFVLAESLSFFFQDMWAMIAARRNSPLAQARTARLTQRIRIRIQTMPIIIIIIIIISVISRTRTT